MSCSLINVKMPHTYTRGVGIVLAPWAHFACAFTGDGGTQGQPMCHGFSAASWPRCTREHWWQCHWYSDQIEDASTLKLAMNTSPSFVI